MLNRLFNQKQLLKDACTRLDNCDELVLMRAFRRLSNTEIGALISSLPVHNANQILIILPNETTRRTLAMGFIPEKMSNDILRKLIGSIDRELEQTNLKSEQLQKIQSRVIETKDESGAAPAVIERDPNQPNSIRFLDVISRFVANSFSKN